MARAEMIQDEGYDVGMLGYFLGGVVMGGCLGILFAPKAGSEFRESLGDWGSNASEKARSLGSKIYEKIPTGVKAAAGLGAVKGGAKEGFREAKSGAEDMLHDVQQSASERLGP